MPFIVAIDGPSGSGKSSVARAVAHKAGLSYVDTGAIYRAVALKMLRLQRHQDDPEAIASLIPQVHIELRDTPMGQEVWLDGEDVTRDIRTEDISQLTSSMSQHKPVRDALLGLQRRLGEVPSHGALLEGRDIGTVVFPDASVKFFLTASAQERAQRRVKQLQDAGHHADLAAIVASIEERDTRDANRAVAPLKQAEDAIFVDTTGLNKDQVVDHLVEIILQKKSGSTP